MECQRVVRENKKGRAMCGNVTGIKQQWNGEKCT